jgi:hypothetical protein
MIEVERYISVFKKDEDVFLGEIDFVVVPELAELQRIAGICEEDPLLYGEIELSAAQLEKLKPYVRETTFDTNKFLYYLSCSSI